ncbi:uncharacterized protein LOC142983845 [Anticarsia gemmatalis]|uniref:uncharacterized protein LOC142983845 n=1 Tax=Anticarsia gemmatalis TaxID=129554 RepID=UPI003F7738B6
MELRILYSLLVIFRIAQTAPSNTGVFNNSPLDEKKMIYTAEYDIVNIIFPRFSLEEIRRTSFKKLPNNPTIFFVLADDVNEKRIDKGIFIRKNRTVSKLLDNGRDADGFYDATKTSFFIAASDGIYSYNSGDNVAEKYGSVTDSIIGIAKCDDRDLIYILTDDHKVYTVTNNGDVVKIEGLPENNKDVKILRPVPEERFTAVIVDTRVYLAYTNGTGIRVGLVTDGKATAYSIEGTFFVYAAYNKKLYEYETLDAFSEDIVRQLSESFQRIE